MTTIPVPRDYKKILTMEQLQIFVGRSVEFDVSKTKMAKGKIVGLDGDLIQVKWTDVPLGLGQV